MRIAGRCDRDILPLGSPAISRIGVRSGRPESVGSIARDISTKSSYRSTSHPAEHQCTMTREKHIAADLMDLRTPARAFRRRHRSLVGHLPTCSPGRQSAG